MHHPSESRIHVTTKSTKTFQNFMGVFYRQREGFFLLSFAMDCTFNRSYIIYLSIFFSFTHVSYM